MSLKKFILSHKILYETYFFIRRKKINRKKLDKQLELLKNGKLAFSQNRETSNVIISLTSYGERLFDLKYTLFSLVLQSVKAEKIIVWIADDEKIPNELKIFEKYGVEFSFCEDIRSYKKLIPALCKYPNRNIVTADDDIFYNKNWLKKLVDEKKIYPNCIVAHIAHKVSFDSDGKLLPYNKWPHNVSSENSSRLLFATGVGGVLWNSADFYRDICNEELFTTLAPKADDVWFYFMSTVLNGTKVKVVKNPCNHLRYVDIYKEYGLNGKSTLASENVNQNLNDKQIYAIMDYYKISDLKSLLESSFQGM